jgi:hypothetical protein
MFLQNVGSHKIYTAPHPRRRNSSRIRGLLPTEIKKGETKEQIDGTRTEQQEQGIRQERIKLKGNEENKI